jgi:hypothetical protein
MTTPFCARTAGGALLRGTGASADGAADADAAPLASSATGAGALAAGESGARADAVAIDAASPGALGPGRMPASRGHTTPTANPTTAMTPTLIQLGRSAPSEGIWTVTGRGLGPLIFDRDE